MAIRATTRGGVSPSANSKLAKVRRGEWGASPAGGGVPAELEGWRELIAHFRALMPATAHGVERRVQAASACGCGEPGR